MTRTPKLLEDLVVDEVSLVDHPANKSARVILLKRGEPNTDHTDTDEEDLKTTVEKAVQNDPILKAQFDAGQIKKVAANVALDERAKEIQKSRGGSYANAYVAAMEELPGIAELAVNG